MPYKLPDFPAFQPPVKALAPDIEAELVQALGGSRGAIRAFLSHYRESYDYILALARGGYRVSLDGTPVCPIPKVTVKRAQNSIEALITASKRDMREVLGPRLIGVTSLVDDLMLTIEKGALETAQKLAARAEHQLGSIAAILKRTCEGRRISTKVTET